MICCGSGSDFDSGSGPDSGSGSRQNLAQFSNNKKFAQNLAFSMSAAAYFPESWPLIFDFLTYVGIKALLKGIKVVFLLVNFGRFP
jgi:hypothetical protein